jgi:hypothetical protein
MLGVSRGMPTSLVPRNVRSDPNPRIFGNRLDGCPCEGTLRFTLQGLNQSIVGLSPLSETAYSTGEGPKRRTREGGE